MTDDEIRAELEAMLQQMGSGETAWADWTPEGEALWRLTHPETIRIDAIYESLKAFIVIARAETRLERIKLVTASL